MGKWLLAVLLTHAADPKTDLVLLDGHNSTVLATIEHLPDASIHGRLVPGTRTAMVVADRARGDFGGALLRVENGKVTQLCDRVFHATTPLVTSDGRTFVERGRPGPQGDEMRIDDLTIEEATAKGMRVVWSGRGYTAHLAGAFGRELIVYHPPSLLGVDMESGKTRTIVRELRNPRDFRVDGNHLVFTQLAEKRHWAIDRVDLTTGALQRLVVAPGVLAPHPWNGDIAYNDHGLRLVGGGRIEHRPGDDVILATSGEVAVGLHHPDYQLEVFEGTRVRQIATPPDSHVQVVGFVK